MTGRESHAAVGRKEVRRTGDGEYEKRWKQ
jgi:hypothetical protein